MKKIMLIVLGRASEIINDISKGAGNELNIIFNDTVLKLVGGALIAGGVVGLFWGMGKIKQGDRAMTEIVGAIVAIVAGGILLTQRFNIF